MPSKDFMSNKLVPLPRPALFSFRCGNPIFGLLLLLGLLLPRIIVIVAIVLLSAPALIRIFLKSKHQPIPSFLKHPDDVPIHEGRTSAVLDGGFVVFIIGARNG